MTETQPLVIAEPKVQIFVSQPNYIRCVAFSPDGKLIAAGSARGYACLWDANTGSKLADYCGKIMPDGKSHEIVSIAFSPDGTCWAWGDRDMVHIFDIQTGDETRSFPTVDNLPIILVDFSPDGKSIVYTTNANIQMLDIQTKQSIWRKKIGDDPGDSMHSATISADKRYLAYMTRSQTVVICETDSGKEIYRSGKWSFSKHCLALSFGGTRTAVETKDRLPKIVIFDSATGQKIQETKRYDLCAEALAFSPDGRIVAVGIPREVMLCDTATDVVIKHLGAAYGIYKPQCMVFSPCGRKLAFVSQNDLVVLDFGKPNLGAPLSSELEYFLRVNQL